MGPESLFMSHALLLRAWPESSEAGLSFQIFMRFGRDPPVFEAGGRVGICGLSGTERSGVGLE
jgi:hypothetical protein